MPAQLTKLPETGVSSPLSRREREQPATVQKYLDAFCALTVSLLSSPDSGRRNLCVRIFMAR
jgi:hypothetical protein